MPSKAQRRPKKDRLRFYHYLLRIFHKFLPLFCCDSSTKKVTMFPLNGNKSSTILQYFTTNQPLNGNKSSTTTTCNWLRCVCLATAFQRAPKPNLAKHRVILLAIDWGMAARVCLATAFQRLLGMAARGRPNLTKPSIELYFFLLTEAWPPMSA